MQARHQLHASVVAAGVGEFEAVVVAAQFHQAGDSPLNSHHLLHHSEGCDLAKALEFNEGFVVAFLLNQSLGQVLAGGLEGCIQREGLAIAGQGGFDVANAGLGQAEVVPGIGVGRGMLQAEPEGFDRFGITLVIAQQVGQAEGRLEVARLITQQQAQFPFSLLGLAGLDQG